MAFSAWRTWVTGETVTAAHMNQEVRDNGEALFPDEDSGVSWSATLEATGSDPDNDTVTARRWRVGPLQFVWFRVVLGVTGGGSGTYFVTLPVAASGVAASGSAWSGQVVGHFAARDSSSVTANSRGGPVLLRASDEVMFQVDASGGNVVTDSNPFAWDAGDVLSFHAVYPVA